ncbi:hypothetical protein TNCV_1553971 [Trichonephila clavipes]|nr:hypothetical protein TNCV_1553971 [Trichonephila clavipes]
MYVIYCDERIHLVTARVLMGGRRLQLQFLYLPCLQETDFGGMCFLSPPLRANSLAKGSHACKDHYTHKQLGMSENFPARKQDNKKATTFALVLDQ